LWAIGVVATLMTIALLVVQLYPGLWEDVAREPVALLKGRVATLIGIGVALTVLIVLLAMGSASLGWTGFRGKTLWDLLQLLIVPLVLVGIGFLFEMQQAEREERRAEAEQKLAEQRAQDEALQGYLDQMNTLLLEHNLRNSKEDSGVRTLARARTLTVLGRLDPSHKTAVMQFLVEAELVQRVEGGRGPIITLTGANLFGADLGAADLSGATLESANLSDADLSGANLFDANLFDANLSGANLFGATLSNANLWQANLSDAKLLLANLSGHDLRTDDLSGANLILANLSDADLSGATLSNADLIDANLSGAILAAADLSGADLSGADLSDAVGVSEEQLKQAKNLEGATMPTGQILKSDDSPDRPTFAEWLQRLQSNGHGEDGENGGP
jgi:uncharacterized protein YjbI with pentapeptide repeats